MGLDTKTNWLITRQSQCDFNFDFEFFVGLEPQADDRSND
jgi:hypothetical protein